jgi:hypothetical protein
MQSIGLIPSAVEMIACTWRQSGRIVIAKNLLWVLRRKHVDGIVRSWADVSLPCSGEPPHCTEKTDETCHANGVIHVGHLDRSHGWEEEHDTDEDDPCHRNGVDRLAPSAHCVRSGVELHLSFVPSVCDDDCDVADIQGWRGNVKDGGDG